MFKDLKSNKSLFRQICICCVLFFAFFSFFTVCGAIPHAVEFRQSVQAVNNSHLAPFPGGEADDSAAVRWDYQCRSNMAVRLDKNNNLRSNVPMPGNGAEIEKVSCSVIPATDSFIWHNQPLKTYYRRLWQKILPSRAGPCA